MDDLSLILGRGKEFYSNLCNHTGSGANPASYTMGIMGPFPMEVLHGWEMLLTTYPHLGWKSRISRSYTSFSLNTYVVCNRTALLYTAEVHRHAHTPVKLVGMWRQPRIPT